MHTKKAADFMFIMLAVLALAISYSVAQSTGLAVASNVTSVDVAATSPVAVMLAADKYVQGAEFKGSVKFHFDRPIGTSTRINVKVLGKSKEFMIEQLLQNASKNYTLAAGVLNGTDPAPVKVLSFGGENAQAVGVILPRYADVRSVAMNISGPPGNQVIFPRLDIGDDGTIDWYYLGDLAGFSESPTKPNGLDDSVPGNVVYINDNTSLLCQKIDLPFARHFKIEANYRKVGSLGDVWATILSPFTEGNFDYVMGGAEKCDLAEDAAAGFKECAQPIVLDYAAKGSNLVCIINKGGYDDIAKSPEYEIRSNGAAPSTTAFRCMDGVEEISCNPVTQSNFYIRVKGGKYSMFLDRMSDFSVFSLSPNAVLVAFRKYVGSQEGFDEIPEYNFGNSICQDEKCLVPIKVIVNGSGYVTLENLKVSYIFEAIPSLETNFYSVMENPPMIDKIGAADLSAKPYELEIPLSAFGMPVPLLPIRTLQSAKMQMEVAVNGNFSEAGIGEFTVYSAAIPDDPSKQMIAEAKESLASLSSSADPDMLSMLEISGMKAAMASAQQQLAGLESEYSASGDSPELQDKINALRQGLPRGVTLLNGASEVQAVSPEDITSDIVSPDKAEDTYNFQGKASVRSTVKSYAIEDFSGAKSAKSVIVKEITAKGQLSRINVFEVIPKGIANSLGDIKFQQTATPVKDDPIAKWFIGSLGVGARQTYRYVVAGDVASADSVKTIIVQSEPEVREEEVEEPAYECGNDVCEEGEDESVCPDDCKKGMSVTMIALIAVGVLALLLAAMRFLKRKKSPFARLEDLNAMADFIRKMRTSGKKDDEIAKMLLAKGWKQEHVKFAIGEIAGPKGSAKGQDDVRLKPMMDYISAALAKGKKPDDIRKVLVSQGWDAKAIDKELGKK